MHICYLGLMSCAVYAGEIEIEEEDKHDGSKQVENKDDDIDSSYSEMKIEAGEYSSDTSPEGKCGLMKSVLILSLHTLVTTGSRR